MSRWDGTSTSSVRNSSGLRRMVSYNQATGIQVQLRMVSVTLEEDTPLASCSNNAKGGRDDTLRFLKGGFEALSSLQAAGVCRWIAEQSEGSQVFAGAEGFFRQA